MASIKLQTWKSLQSLLKTLLLLHLVLCATARSVSRPHAGNPRISRQVFTGSVSQFNRDVCLGLCFNDCVDMEKFDVYYCVKSCTSMVLEEFLYVSTDYCSPEQQKTT